MKQKLLLKNLMANTKTDSFFVEITSDGLINFFTEITIHGDIWLTVMFLIFIIISVYIAVVGFIAIVLTIVTNNTVNVIIIAFYINFPLQLQLYPHIHWLLVSSLYNIYTWVSS